MKKILMISFLAAGVVFVIGCTKDNNGSEDEMTKDEARDLGKADWWSDLCEHFGWYDDGVCDDFCPEPDQDCIEESRCGPWPEGECDSGEICDIRTCAIGGGGVCVPDFDACIEIYDPVCGCDGKTYGNDCLRLLAGESLNHEGECDESTDQCGGIGGLMCAEGMICDIRSCYPDAMGVCIPDFDACAEIYDPVCGCDGKTYGNDCLRLLAGRALNHEGECDESTDQCGGIGGLMCAEGMICDIRFCYPDAMGVCVPDFDACYELYDPVCGCNGVTYSNDCRRLLAGAALNHEGPCGGPEPGECGPFPGGLCAEGKVCDINSCGLGASGVCVLRPEICPMIYDPVCGCNGVTYSNNCMRLISGTALDHEGPC